MSLDTTKTFYKNPSPDNNSVISRTSSQDTPEGGTEGDLDPVSSGSETADQESLTQLHEESGDGSTQLHEESGGGSLPVFTPVSEATVPQDATSLANQENKVEKRKSSTKLVERGEGPGEEREVFNGGDQVIAGVRPTLESNGEDPAKSCDDELATSGPREPVPEVGGAMMEESIEETIEGKNYTAAQPAKLLFYNTVKTRHQ